ncbi:MAG: hypothetical protein QOI58_684, partial [Thermoanaerobaculia bacterium]|nr:hypothetical protein [Thermoanaerobaculia bacterium]
DAAEVKSFHAICSDDGEIRTVPMKNAALARRQVLTF